MRNKKTEDITSTKKHYTPPRLLVQDHMSRVTQKTSGGADGAPGFLNKDDNIPDSGGSSDGESQGGSSGEGFGGLFDNPFDD